MDVQRILFVQQVRKISARNGENDVVPLMLKPLKRLRQAGVLMAEGCEGNERCEEDSLKKRQMDEDEVAACTGKR